MIATVAHLRETLDDWVCGGFGEDPDAPHLKDVLEGFLDVLGAIEERLEDSAASAREMSAAFNGGFDDASEPRF